jgi:hypothetical protein
VKTDTVINRKKLVRFVFKKNMPALAIRIVDEQIEQHDGFQGFFIFA